MSVSPTNGSFPSMSSITLTASTSALVLMGFEITGPVPLTTSKSTPMDGRGVRMSENMITPSTPKVRHGCRDSSIAISGVSERCRKGYLSEYLRNALMYRPACDNEDGWAQQDKIEIASVLGGKFSCRIIA